MYSLFPIRNLILHPGTLFLHHFFPLRIPSGKKLQNFFEVQKVQKVPKVSRNCRKCSVFCRAKRFPSFFQILSREKWNFFGNRTRVLIFPPLLTPLCYSTVSRYNTILTLNQLLLSIIMLRVLVSGTGVLSGYSCVKARKVPGSIPGLAELVFQCEGVSRPIDPQYQRHTEHTHASVDTVLTTNALLEELIPGTIPGLTWCAQALSGLGLAPVGGQNGGPFGAPRPSGQGAFLEKKKLQNVVCLFSWLLCV